MFVFIRYPLFKNFTNMQKKKKKKIAFTKKTEVIKIRKLNFNKEVPNQNIQ